MLHVVCVKWGTKYGPEWVNRLKTMVDRNLSLPYKFYCYTDDPTGLDEDVNVIPIPNQDLEIYWNKLAMFQKDFLPEGTCLYFDLDVVIQRDLEPLLEYLSDDLTMIKAYWKGDHIVSNGSSRKEKERWDMYANSSILLWKSNYCTHIWDSFNSDPEWFMMNYKGIDRFIFHEGMGQKYFPKGLIYSRLIGCDFEDRTGGEYYDNQSPEDWDNAKGIMLYNIPDYIVCLFNGPTRDWMYKGFEKYWGDPPMRYYIIGMSDNERSVNYMKITRPIIEQRIDGQLELWEATTPETMHQYDKLVFGKKMPPLIRIQDAYRDFTDTEKAVWYSHYRLWKHVYETGTPAWIFEHDVDMSAVDELPDVTGYDIVTIPNPGSLWCYYINKRGAKKILQKLDDKMREKPLNRNVDGFLDHLMTNHTSVTNMSKSIKLDVKCFMDYGRTIEHIGDPFIDEIKKDPSKIHFADPSSAQVLDHIFPELFVLDNISKS